MSGVDFVKEPSFSHHLPVTAVPQILKNSTLVDHRGEFFALNSMRIKLFVTYSTPNEGYGNKNLRLG